MFDIALLTASSEYPWWSVELWCCRAVQSRAREEAHTEGLVHDDMHLCCSWKEVWEKSWQSDWLREADRGNVYRNCPPTHCECHRTDRRLSESEEKRLLQRVIPPRVKDTGVYIDDARDDGRWKLKAKIRPEPVSDHELKRFNYTGKN